MNSNVVYKTPSYKRRIYNSQLFKKNEYPRSAEVSEYKSLFVSINDIFRFEIVQHPKWVNVLTVYEGIGKMFCLIFWNRSTAHCFLRIELKMSGTVFHQMIKTRKFETNRIISTRTNDVRTSYSIVEHYLIIIIIIIDWKSIIKQVVWDSKFRSKLAK